MVAVNTKNKGLFRIASFIIVILMLFSIFSNSAISATVPKNLKVTFLNVGQGDAIFIELPNKYTMLIDAGDNDGNTILNFMKDRGYISLTYVVATHPHADHIGGFPAVFAGTIVRNFWMPKVSTTTTTFQNLLKAVQNEGCGIKTAKAGVTILNTTVNSYPLKVTMLAPVSTTYDNLNDYSAVIKLVYGNRSFLFMGDAQTTAENQITASVDVNVLKVGHHGSSSSTSTAFLQKVTPNYAVISCGMYNSYGHPHATVLDRLKSMGIKIFRTDLSGTIVFTCNGALLSINKTPNAGQPGSYYTDPTTQPTTSPSTNNYIGNVNTHKFHRPSCSYLPDVANRIYFSTRAQAISAGYVPCSYCKP